MTALAMLAAAQLAVIGYLATELSDRDDGQQYGKRDDRLARLQPEIGALTPPDGRAVADAVARQAVSVTVYRTDEPEIGLRVGSGVLLDAGLVLTAGHLFDDGFTEKVTPRVYCHGRRVEAELLFADTEADLAALAAPDCQAQRLQFSARDPLPEERLHVAGFEHDAFTGNPYWFHVTTWLLPDERLLPEFAIEPALRHRLQRQADGLERPYLAVNSGFVAGNSGSYVFNDDGELVAMIIGNKYGPDHGFMMPAKSIQETLTKHGVRY